MGTVSKISDGDGGLVLRCKELGRYSLKTQNQVAEEMARVYRATAVGKISTKLGGQLAFQLGVLSKTLEAAAREMPMELEDATVVDA
jgi:hypothetical protein